MRSVQKSGVSVLAFGRLNARVDKELSWCYRIGYVAWTWGRELCDGVDMGVDGG